jgi:hypothetical protein
MLPWNASTRGVSACFTLCCCLSVYFPGKGEVSVARCPHLAEIFWVCGAGDTSSGRGLGARGLAAEACIASGSR